MVGDGPKQRWYRVMAEVYSAMGMNGKAQECINRAKG
jgi:hypothetical protein